MANPNCSNLVLGGATLYYAPVGTALPLDSLALGATWLAPWARLGMTAEPVVIKYEDTLEGVMVDEFLAPIRAIRTEESLELETSLGELVNQYLGIASNNVYLTDTNDPVTNIGGNTNISVWMWGIEGSYMNAANVLMPLRAYIWRGVPKLNGELSFSKKSTDPVAIPFKVIGLADCNRPAGEQLMRWEWVVIP
jgi:hypothetical protein